jgi:UTP--glucose-1-phosphate uridylyltransferase
VWCARNFAGDEPVAVLLADDLILSAPGCLKQMVAAHGAVGGNMLAVMEVAPAETASYGVIAPGGADGRLVQVDGLVEKPKPQEAPSNLAVIGRYIIQPAVFDDLARMERGAGDEIQLTDALARQIGKHPFHGFKFDGTRFDCGNKTGFLEANIAFALARPDMAAGVRKIIHSYAKD